MVKQNPRPNRDAASDLTQANLQAYLSYEPETGVFTRLRDGKAMGTPSGSKRLVIYVDGFLYLAHRLAWLYVYGIWPSGILDHKNRNDGDNRIANLRMANKGQNAINSEATWSASGLRGVYYQKNTRLWRVKVAGVNVGYFATKEAAHAAYRAKAVELYGEFAQVA